MDVRQWLPLCGIVLCVFVFNMSEFMPIGLLTSISTDLGISESQTGTIISLYAWAVAILSVPLMLILNKMQYRPMLLLFVGLFAVFQILSGLANDYYTLVAARLGVAVAHAVFWSIAAPLAVKVVEPRYRLAALSAVATGTSIAMIVGLPLGRVIGLALGWRMTFYSIAAVTMMTFVLLLAVFPKVQNPGTFSARKLPGLFKDRVLLGIYLLIALFVTGYYTGYSYIEPFLLDVVGMSPELVTLALTLFGFAGIGGSILFSKRYGKKKYLYLFISPGGVLLVMALLDYIAFSTVLVFVACAAWGFCGTMTTTAYQNEAILASPEDATPVAIAMFSGIFNVGIALGSIIGGFVVSVPGIETLGANGAFFVLLAVVFVGLFLIRWIKAADDARAE